MKKILGAVLASLAFTTMSAQAATITVNSSLDPIPANLADGLCTLREAINSANANAAVNDCTPGQTAAGGAPVIDNIVFALPGGASTVVVNAGIGPMPPIIDGVVINGAGGPGGTVIVAPTPIGGLTPFFVVADRGTFIGPAVDNVNVTFQNLTMNGATQVVTPAVGSAIDLRNLNTGGFQQNLTVSNVIFNNNTNALGGAAGGDLGGAVGVTGNVNVTVTNSQFYGNTADRGGAVAVNAVDPVSATATGVLPALTVTGSTFGNGTPAGANTSIENGTNCATYCGGGAISIGNPNFVLGAASTISGSTFNGNVAANNGGAIETWGSNGLTITNSNFTGNAAANGGALGHSTNDGAGVSGTTITGSTFSANTATTQGGAIALTWSPWIGPVHPLTILNSTLDSNTAGNAGNAGGAIHIGNGGTRVALTINASTISNNKATNAAGTGGGISVQQVAPGVPTDVLVLNSTISGNTAKAWAGGIDGNAGTTQVNNSTITNNMADADGVGGEGGGGVGTAGGAFINLTNTILAANTVGVSGFGPDCVGGAGGVTSQDFNIIGSNAGCGYAAAANDQVGNTAGGGSILNPLLGALMVSSGPTATHDPQAGSPAIDMGNNAIGCQDGTGNVLVVDQQGNPRPSGAACDVGSVEIQPPPPNPTAGTTKNNGAIAPTTANAGDADLEVVSLQLTNTSNPAEPLVINSITVLASPNTNTATNITGITLYNDAACDGDATGDAQLTTATNFGTINIPGGVVVAPGAQFCVVVTINTNATLASLEMPMFAASSLMLIGMMGLGGFGAGRGRKLALILLSCLVFGLAGCHGDDDDGGTTGGTGGGGGGGGVTPPKTATYSISITGVNATGQNSGNPANVGGVPAAGQTITISE